MIAWCIRVVVASLCLLPETAVACLWDYDTLAMERSRFPSTLELITGKFRRHSVEFYRWRIDDRLSKLKTDPNSPEWLDDLAVAYDKVGLHSEAIKTMRRSVSNSPARYETVANLGTFYVHSGDFEEGLEWIHRAIEINPDAHFGREVYQARLVQYVIKQRSAGRSGLPLQGSSSGIENFYYFVSDSVSGAQRVKPLTENVRAAAIRGVLGMMRFGNYTSPILLEALGDLLSSGHTAEDAKRLAARAYLKASYEVQDDVARIAYRRLAAEVLLMQRESRFDRRDIRLREIESTFERELTDARAWFEGLRKDELRWIEEGLDVDAEFARKYYEVPPVQHPFSLGRLLARAWSNPVSWIVVISVLVALAVIGRRLGYGSERV